jgi:hypothetical protein
MDKQSLSEKYDKIISLGCNCFIKFYLKHIEYEQETYFFDYIGCPMWSVYELIKNDFSNLFNLNEYKNEYTIMGLPQIVTNSRYNLKFKHDLSVVKSKFDNEFSDFKEKYTRRIKRFRDLLMSSENVLFIRFEETKENRIIKQAYKEQNKISELEYIKLFSKFLRSHFPELKFEIVFISKSWNDSVDEENNITTIREIPKNKISDYKVAGSQIEELLNNKFYCYK